MDKLLRDGLSRLGINLVSADIDRLLLFLDELLRWNQRINLTSIRSREDAIEKHLIDSLALLPYLGPAAVLVDMGSGAGLPGIPLAIVRPDLCVQSVDSVGKKISFQKHVKRLLQLDNLYPESTRLEDYVPSRSPTHVLARAFASLTELLSYAAPLLPSAGVVYALKGPEGEAELRHITENPESLPFSIAAVHRYQLPFSKAERLIIVCEKKSAE